MANKCERVAVAQCAAHCGRRRARRSACVCVCVYLWYARLSVRVRALLCASRSHLPSRVTPFSNCVSARGSSALYDEQRFQRVGKQYAAQLPSRRPLMTRRRARARDEFGTRNLLRRSRVSSPAFSCFVEIVLHHGDSIRNLNLRSEGRKLSGKRGADKVRC